MLKNGKLYQRHPYDWTHDPWTGDDRPFLRVMAEVDRQLKHFGDPADYVVECRQRAKSEAHQQSYNPIDQFRWAYAAYRAYQIRLDVKTKGQFNWAGTCMGYGDSPHSYQYDRLRFLLLVEDEGEALRPLGERLIRRNPADYEVKYLFTTRIMAPNPDRQRMLSYAKDLQELRPHDPRYLLAFATANYGVGVVKGDLKMQETVIGYYQKFLNAVPANDPRREGIEKEIALIRKFQEIDRTHPRSSQNH